MAIGERIRFIRNLRGMTQKWLGIAVGFPEKTADIRMAQYESGSRSPKEELTEKLAEVLDVSPAALNVPDIESYVGIMHTLFTLEDLYGLKIDEVDGEPVIRLNKSAPEYSKMIEMFLAWQKQAQMWRDGEITKQDYDQWRYKYPELDKSNKRRHKMTPSSKLNDALTDELMKDHEKRRK